MFTATGIEVASLAGKSIKACLAAILACETYCSIVIIVSIDAATIGSIVSKICSRAQRAIVGISLTSYTLIVAFLADWLIHYVVVPIHAGTGRA